MNKIDNFIKKNLNIIIIIFMILWVFQTCNMNSNIKNIKKEFIKNEIKRDSINNDIIKNIKTEGLRSESRMIQATDRKMLDVQRQNEIEKEIKKLNGK